jgi:intracellular sulfur oxidation DsrE/DsrF family protein
MRPNITIALLFTALLLSNALLAENINTNSAFSYHVNFDDSQSHSDTLDDIQQQIDNRKVGDEELKIILFGHGRALSLHANALQNTKLEYGDNNQKIKNKMMALEKQGVNFIICKSHSTNKKYYSTRNKNSTTASELRRLQSMGYECND